jgi:hypothetical protein
LNAWFELVSAPSAPDPTLPEELAKYYSAIPRAFSALPEATEEWQGSPERPALNLTAQNVQWLDFIPGEVEQPKLLMVQPTGERLSLKFDASQQQPSKPLRGLAVGQLDGKTAFFDVNLAWPIE